MVFEDGPNIQVASLPPELVRRVEQRMTEALARPERPQALEASAGAQAFAPPPAAPPSAAPPGPPPAPAYVEDRRDDEINTMEDEEKKIILRALSITDGNISEAARRLGLHRSTLHRKMARFGLATDEDPEAGDDGAPVDDES
ncbi:MAG: helix-turn-helix domain-containing protein [Planctomycetota bacterium]|nr:helix-turn-helix domain-containing protein [Planctomycetota bacterium]